MQVPQASKIVVLGLGNTILSDDGVGIRAVEALERDARTPLGVDLIDGGTKGLELACYASDASKLLLLDALDVGEPPGTVVRIRGSDLLGLPAGKTVHELGLADLLATLHLVAAESLEIVVLGVQPATTELGTALSPAVEMAVGPLVDEAIAQLALWAQQRAAALAASPAMAPQPGSGPFVRLV